MFPKLSRQEAPWGLTYGNVMILSDTSRKKHSHQGTYAPNLKK